MSIRFELWPVETKERYLTFLRALGRGGAIDAASVETARVMAASVDFAGRPAGEAERFLAAVLAEAGLVVRESNRGDVATSADPREARSLRPVARAPSRTEAPLDRRGQVVRYIGAFTRGGSTLQGWEGDAVAVSGQLVLTTQGKLWRHVDPVGYVPATAPRAIRSSSRASAYLGHRRQAVELIDGDGVRGGLLSLGEGEEVADFAVRQTTVVAVGRDGTLAMLSPVTGQGGGLKRIGGHRAEPVRALVFGWSFALLTKEGAVRPLALNRGTTVTVGDPLSDLPQIVQMTGYGLMLGEDGSLWLLRQDHGVTRCRARDVIRVRDDLALTRTGELVTIDLRSGSTMHRMTLDPAHVIDFCARGSDGSVLVLTDAPSRTASTAGGAR